jgi:hypothetical protein
MIGFRYLLAILLALAGIASARADNYIEWVGANSGIDWTQGKAQAEGAGLAKAGSPPSLAKLMACRAAVVDAQRNLLESVQGVRVEGITIVDKLMLESDIIKSSVQGLLRGSVISDRRPQADGTCEVTLTAPLAGNFATQVYTEIFDEKDNEGLSDLVLDGSRWLASIINAISFDLITQAYAETTDSWQEPLNNLAQRISALETLLSARPKLTIAKDLGPTGLVIDARGSNFIPSMSPKIRKLRAGIIYPNAKHQKTRTNRGQLVSLFTRQLDTARQHPVVGERPLVLKALRTWGKTRTEIVLGTESSERLAKLVTEGLLEDAGVIIVL